MQKFFGGTQQNVRVQGIYLRRQQETGETHSRYSRFKEKDSTSEAENVDSEGDGKDQEDDTPVNAT
tara:strand:- start:5591 stop:5788 length:198 start_codon:yes stop_codon:yes gene_type:complete